MKEDSSNLNITGAPADTAVITAPDKAQSALSWPTSQHPIESGVQWLDEAAQFLQCRFGLAPAASYLAPLCALGAAVGPAVRASTPEGLSVSAQINTAWIDRPGSRVRDALATCFHMALARCDGLRFNRLNRTDDDIRREFSKLAATLDGGSRWARSDSPVASEIIAFMVGCQASRKAKPDAEAILGKIAELGFVLRPHLIAEDLSIRQLLQPQELSCDGSVASVSLDGSAGSRLRNASRNQLVDLAALAIRTCQARFRACAIQAPESSAICCWLMEESDVGFILGDPIIRSTGIPRAFLFVEAAAPNPEHQYGGIMSEQTCDGLNATVNGCWEYRLAGKHAIVLPNGDATANFMAHADKRCKQLSRFGAAAEGVPAFCPSMLHKVALLLHLARHRGSAKGLEKSIDEGTVRAAVDITDAALASHLDLCARYGARGSQSPQEDNRTEIELVIARLRVRGPLSARELARTFHRRKTGEIKNLVAAAIEAGIVRENAGKYALIGNQ